MIFLLGVILSVSPLQAESQEPTPPASQQSPWRPNYFTSDRGYLQDVPAERLQEYLQRFVSQVYGRAIENIGVPEDFDHGHLLYRQGRDGRPAPFAILYHLQEDASLAEEFQRRLDPDSRNWLQWIDSPERPAENARAYARQKQPAAFRSFAEANTIISLMLDPQLLGGQVVRDAQWSFRRADCGADHAYDFEVRLPSSEALCLRLNSR